MGKGNSQMIYVLSSGSFFFLLKILFIFRGEGREIEGENFDVQEIRRSLASCMPPSGDLACIPGMCPDWESIQ